MGTYYYESRTSDYLPYLEHYGVKGMKWGIRKQKDAINSNRRTIKSGTELQTITEGQYQNGKRKRLYTSYTDYDKSMYVDLMGNYMYNQKGYKNTFMVKKDISVASDKDVVNEFIKLAKDNPDQVARDMANAYNDIYIFKHKTEKSYRRKISRLNDPESKRARKLAEDFVANSVLSEKAETSANKFYANLVKEGFDAISDTSDRKQGAQDPMIIVNMNKLNHTGSMKLSKKDLDYYMNYSVYKKLEKKGKDLSSIQR